MFTEHYSLLRLLHVHVGQCPSRDLKMASKRVALSAVNWGAISQRVPKKQRESFNLLKNASDKYVIRIAEKPNVLPKIEFAEYKAKLPHLAAMVGEFEKQYGAVQVPYPKDNSDVKGALIKEETMVRERSSNYIANETKHLHSLETMLKKIETVPAPEQMTLQMFNHYFPENAINPNADNPGFWPQMEEEFQLQNLRAEGRSQQFIQDPKNWAINLDSLEDFEQEWLEKVCKWEAEEMTPKLNAIIEGYQAVIDGALEKHLANMKETQGEEAVKKFKKDPTAIQAFKEKAMKENGITKERYIEEAVAVVGPIKEFETLQEYLDALEEK